MSADDLDSQLDELLTRTQPSPTVAFESELERRLFRAPTVQTRRRSLAGLAAATGGLAAVLIVAGLAGSGPLATGGGDAAKAKPGCKTVFVTKVAPSGQLVRKADGSVTFETTSRPVTHEQQHCR